MFEYFIVVAEIYQVFLKNIVLTSYGIHKIVSWCLPDDVLIKQCIFAHFQTKDIFVEFCLRVDSMLTTQK